MKLWAGLLLCKILGCFHAVSEKATFLSTGTLFSLEPFHTHKQISMSSYLTLVCIQNIHILKVFRCICFFRTDKLYKNNFQEWYLAMGYFNVSVRETIEEITV